MLELVEMPSNEMRALLTAVSYGHLGCCKDGNPYVLPINYAYEDPDIYIFTTEGMKTNYIAANPEVCLQVEEVKDQTHWRSVIAQGAAERLSTNEDVEKAMQLITLRNPTLTPALSTLWTDAWGRASNVVIYRIRPHKLSGRQTA
jgi:uncharacterized protein